MYVAHASMFYKTTPDQLFINNISPLLPHLYLVNTSEYQSDVFLHICLKFLCLIFFVFNIFCVCYFFVLHIFWESFTLHYLSLCIIDTGNLTFLDVYN